MRSMTDLAWVAGIVEGEGWLGTRRRCGVPPRQRDGYEYTAPEIKIVMTDLDVMERVANVMGLNVRRHGKPAPNRKEIFEVGVVGRPAVAWMLTLYSMLGRRRREQAAKAIRLWRNAPTRVTRYTSTCHPERPHRAKGLCAPCYYRERDTNRRAAMNPAPTMEET
jgi:hypothetical protein